MRGAGSEARTLVPGGGDFLRYAHKEDQMSDWITTFATLVLAVLTGIYVWLTRRILDAQSDPCVIITVMHDEDRPSMLQLVVSNVGTGIANDIRLEFSRPLPAKAFGISEEEAKQPEEMTDGPLIDGIPALGPGECRKIDWGQYGGLKKALGDSQIVATCRFKKQEKEMKPMICPLDIASFKGTAAPKSSSAKAADALEKISKSLNRIATNLKTED